MMLDGRMLSLMRNEQIAMCRQIQELAIASCRKHGWNLDQSQIRDAFEAFCNVRLLVAEQLVDIAAEHSS